MLRVNEDMRLNTQLSKYWRRLSIACLRLRIFKKLPTNLLYPALIWETRNGS